MRRIVAYIAASVDGFTAGSNDDLNGLPDITSAESGYDEVFSRVGAIAMGRRTYEVSLSFDVFAAADLIDEWILTVVPVILGSGTSLASPGAAPALGTRGDCPAARGVRADPLSNGGAGRLIGQCRPTRGR